MTKLSAFLAAGLIALTAAASPASAGGYRHHDHSGDVWAGAAVGLLGGVLLGQALSAPSYPAPVYVAPPPRVYYRQPAPIYVRPGPIDEVGVYDDHAAWCASRYRSYNVHDDTWVDRHGRLRVCVSPFN